MFLNFLFRNIYDNDIICSVFIFGKSMEYDKLKECKRTTQHDTNFCFVFTGIKLYLPLNPSFY